VHLRAIRLRGFKSFPDPVEVRLEPGVAVVVGPNGSGKSNISDAIVWAAGSLMPSELRAEKADDVLFAGGAGRQPADWCEVELLFDNPDGELAGLDFSEVSVVRRLHRGGEGQYLVNRASVRRTDLVELLADVGLGSGMHSVIGQGKVEAILSSSPEERRALVEEAAGLGRFKRRRHRAELKLARVGREVERARDLEAEVKKRVRPLALQATAAERAEKLRGEIASVQARLAHLDLAALDEQLASADERKAAASLARKRVEGTLEGLLEERRKAEEDLADAAGRREAATASLYRLRSSSERVGLRREPIADLLERFRAELSASDAPDGLRETAAKAAAEARRAASERDALAEQARVARERLEALERSLAEREGIPPAARALSEEGRQLALGLLEVEPGYERAVAAALLSRASALTAASAQQGLELLERARRDGLGTLVVVVPPAADRSPARASPLSEHVRTKAGGEHVLALLAGVSVVEEDELLGAQGVAVTQEGYGFSPATGELWFAGEAAESVLLELEGRRRALAAEAEELSAKEVETVKRADEKETRARESQAAWERAGGHGSAARALREVLERLSRLAERALRHLDDATTAADRLEAPLKARADVGGERTAALADDLRRLGGEEAEARRELAVAGEQAGAIDVELARLQAERREVERRLEAAAAEPAAGEREELEPKLERLERRLITLGQVNPLAKEEYEAEKERLQELKEQREDLEASLDELEKLRDELTETVERRFEETFERVRKNFHEVASTLFPGGEGRLRLTQPAEDEEEAEPGVEVELRPAGKRVTRLSLLSGGEKALGAISFLFALFLARPCPFYLLDEVEAALDDPNIGRFIELLRRFSDRAQFIVITHQKRTMEAADSLYGVTMGPDGVSQIVSRRVPREEEAALAS
jgi:chromosome segregation protein